MLTSDDLDYAAEIAKDCNCWVLSDEIYSRQRSRASSHEDTTGDADDQHDAADDGDGDGDHCSGGGSRISSRTTRRRTTSRSSNGSSGSSSSSSGRLMMGRIGSKSNSSSRRRSRGGISGEILVLLGMSAIVVTSDNSTDSWQYFL